MKSARKYCLAAVVCGFASLAASAQQTCPNRPVPGSIVQDALSIPSVNGTLTAQFIMGHSVDSTGYTHYCYNYRTNSGAVESPTLRLNPGDTLDLDVVDRIANNDGSKVAAPTRIQGKQLVMGLKDGPAYSDPSKMAMEAPSGTPCGDSGTATINSTNVHFHGLDVTPNCHGDDVVNTLIQPGTPGFQYGFQIPTSQPPGLYWYHPHIHGFTEFQVNGGAAGALVVNGMEKVRPEVAGLTERVFVIRQQYLVPWVPGPYQLTINYQVADHPPFPAPIIQMAPGEKQFWRVANATIQDFVPVQVLVNNVPQQLQLIALDGYPLAATRMQTSILIPPAGRAEFIVQAPPKGQFAEFFTQSYSTGPTGNADLQNVLAEIQLTGSDSKASPPAKPVQTAAVVPQPLKYSDLGSVPATQTRKLYFSEEFGGTNGPIQFYITVEGQKQHVFETNEKPVITTHVGAVEDWTVENRALETHAFHIHQIHFRVLEIDGKPAPNQDLRDTIEIPYWSGPGTPYHSVKLRMDFRDPGIAGTFVFHCHILLHEDLGMMHKILVEP